MQLLLVGVSHRTAPIELRERLDFSARGVDRALSALAGSGAHHEATIVSTCNRVELYVGCDDPEAARPAIQNFLSEFHGISGDQLAPHLYSKTGHDAVTHLYRVAAGLDSLVMGEPQILGQVKEAFGVAIADGLYGPAPEQAVSFCVCGRQAGAHGDRARRGRGLGQLRRGRACAKDLRQSQVGGRFSSSAPARWESSPLSTCSRRASAG